MLKSYLKRLLHGASLRADEMAEAIGYIMDGNATQAELAAFLVALRCKGETAEEIAGAARAMRSRMTRIEVQRRPLIDTCGTGGDGAGTFNISTAVAFVVAAAGVGVAKHGNRAVSSRSGSADVLAELGVNIEAEPAVVKECVEEVGIGFLFAPSLHPAMRHVAAVRRELGVRTVFNVLGPLTNPTSAPMQLLGVFDRSLLRPVAETLGMLGAERAWIVHGADGLDEISVCDATYAYDWTGKEIVKRRIAPEELGLTRSSPEGLRGGTPAENAAIMQEVLSGERTGPIADAVAINAAAALTIAGSSDQLLTGLGKAKEILRTGAARDVLEKLKSKSNAHR